MNRAFMVLGLPETSTPGEIKARWRKLCMIHHPDRGGSLVEFDKIFKAYRSAYEEASQPKECQRCLGIGKIKQTRDWSSIDMACQACGGSGHEDLSSLTTK